MARITHPATGFYMGDPEALPLDRKAPPTRDEVYAALSTMILSASGWRKVFAADGNEESRGDIISAADCALVGAAALAFARYLKKKTGNDAPTVVVGLDTRPTGPVIADAMIRVLMGVGIAVRYLFIAAAPEIMAFTRKAAENPEASGGAKPDGFVYVSASHNPIGHNGLKFGLTDGGVLDGKEAKLLIDDFRYLLSGEGTMDAVCKAMADCPAQALADVYIASTHQKRYAISAYTLFTREVVTGFEGLEDQERILDAIAASLERRPLGILAELNGSARTVSIDANFLTGIGVKLEKLNDRPREIAHRIVPEGESLKTCRQVLEKLNDDSDAFVLGYVPDCDGDRGNVVLYDEKADVMRIPEAQDVFALSVLAELSFLVYSKAVSYGPDGKPSPKLAVVVNDPTSLRIDSIARAFGAEVFRAEVGEANVVNRAREAREAGYLVKILGEGSNGGNITHPSAVRDPIDTVAALVKLYALRASTGLKGVYEIWCDKSGTSYNSEFGFADILASLPKYSCTSAFEPEAAMTVKTADHGVLKERYERIFLRDWPERLEELKKRFGVVSWRAFAYNGTAERPLAGNFGLSGKGGLKILLLGEEGDARGSLWMRGSGTEAIFRIMAEIAGNDREGERWLLAWQAAMITEADGAVT
jgi:phosphoglucomutase